MRLDDADSCAQAIVKRLGRHIVMGLPLGLGKPVQLANALYRLAAADSRIKLDIFTALTLEAPAAGSGLQRRFLKPLLERVFGRYPGLDYARDRRLGRLPGNVKVTEFYFAPGSQLGMARAQQEYCSVNYTQVHRELLARGVNLLATQVAVRERDGAQRLSLSSNPDLTLDLATAGRAREDFLVVGQTNHLLPFMPNDAEVDEDYFDLLLDQRAYDLEPFPLLNRPVGLADYAAGLHVASLVKDGGTLQVGIGAMGDAVVNALVQRQHHNAGFRQLVQALVTPGHLALRQQLPVEDSLFEQGLFGSSEMLVHSFAGLHDAGVLKRRVRQAADGSGGYFLEAAFFLGPRAFYRWLNEQPDAVLAGINMTSVNRVNHLYGNETQRRAERVHARFINEAMMVTLGGAVVSDGLADGQVVSGVGGQYNFVAMAHELEGGRSIIMLPATRRKGGKLQSNIVWEYPHATIPRHLRDIVVTEYGAADLRGASDRDVIAALLCLADKQFQPGLLAQAKAAGKIEAGYEIPAAFRRNTEADLRALLLGAGQPEWFPHFPWRTEMTAAEAALAVALGYLKQHVGGWKSIAASAWKRPARGAAQRFSAELERMGLERPRGLQARLQRRLLLNALEQCMADQRPLALGSPRHVS
jgi:acyl-CoA hydrolase